MGMVFHIQRFSLYDGPGVRTVVFLKGCPLRCRWCHNPEGLTREQQIQFNPAKCIGCMDCVSVCPQGCHISREGVHLYQRENCRVCGACADNCCSGALNVMGVQMSPEDVMEQVLRDKGMYGQEGGLTLSGGEPFAQAEFAIQLLQLAKAAGLHTCVETSGYADSEKITQAARFVDLFLFDWKATDAKTHEKLCGVSNEKILSNLKQLENLGKEVILRCPIIPGCNDDPAHIRGIGELAQKYDCIQQVHLMPYHRLGVNKAAQLGQVIFETHVPEGELMEQYRQQIENLSGKSTRING